MATRFLEINCHVQCMGCNMFKKGNYDEYALYLLKHFGDDILDKLNKLKHSVVKWSTVDYEEKIAYYQAEVDKLLNVKANIK